MDEGCQFITIKEGWTVDCRKVVKWLYEAGQLKVTVTTDYGEYSVVLEGTLAETANEVLQRTRRPDLSFPAEE